MKKLALAVTFSLFLASSVQAQIYPGGSGYGIDKSSPKLMNYNGLDAINTEPIPVTGPKMDAVNTEPIVRAIDLKSKQEVVFSEKDGLFYLTVEGKVLGVFEPLCLNCEEIEWTY